MTFKKWWVSLGWNLGHIFSRLGVLDDVYDIAEKAYKVGYDTGVTNTEKRMQKDYGIGD